MNAKFTVGDHQVSRDLGQERWPAAGLRVRRRGRAGGRLNIGAAMMPYGGLDLGSGAPIVLAER